MAGKIYVVVPVFNRKPLIERFLYCMREQTFQNFETIVVDDGSTDGTGELITTNFKEVELLRGDGNLWWTGAINLGIKHVLAKASGDAAILVINDDVEVDPDYLQTLHKMWRSTPRALLGSVVVDIDHPEVIVDGGRIVNWWLAKFTMVNSERRLSEFPRDHYVDASLLTGWGTLIPIQVFREIGLYDDKHFQQCGDTELPVRAKNAGYRLMVSYRARVKVHVDASDAVNVAIGYSLWDAKHYFFGVKSNFRIKYRFFLGFNTARNPLAFLSFLVFDGLRITGHFFLRLRFR
jgi:N-acetylglucosaminyl-diphospho-decaprenol L-rhamnosyltransferase